MAAVGAQYLTPATSFPPLSTNSPPPPRMQPVLLHSAISTPFRSKPTRRKNYLRQKLLKTVTKPVIPNTNPVIPIESPHESETQESQVSTAETAGILSGNFGNFSARSVFQLGLYLVGAFVFQTICAVWIWGSVNSDQKDGNLDSGSKTRVLELSGKGDNEAKPGFFMNGSGGSVSGRGKSRQWPELDERIVEIQAMARETRERERLDSKENGSDDYDDVQTEIEEEVDLRVANLLKRLQNSNKKSPVFPVRNLGKGAGSQDGANKPLMFRKRHKFRSPSGNPSDKPEGFPGSEDQNLTRNGNGSAIVEDALLGKGSVDKEQLLYHPNGNSRGNVSLPLDEDSGRKLSKDKSKSFETQRKKLGNGRAKAKVGKEYGIAKPEQGSGATREKGFGRPSVKAGRLRKATAGSKRASGKVEIKPSDDKADLWWLSLPYVLAIFMRRGNDDEGQSGLFTLKITPYVEDEDSYEDPSHFVAFEDRGDATNFCYLLESFFEDLGDFSAEIVPLPIKELNEAVSSDATKVIVVKKGQLKLYAGQPLAEVENELRSIVK